MVFQFLKILEMSAANRANQKLSNLSIHTLQQLLMYHLEDLVLHQVWQVVPVRITKWKECHIHGPGRYPKGMLLQLGSLTTRVLKFVILNTYIYPQRLEVCASNLSDGVYDKVTLSSITGVVLSADFGVSRKSPRPRGGAISWNPKIRTETTPVILLGSTWERCFKVVLRFVVGGILKRAFCLECGLC